MEILNAIALGENKASPQRALKTSTENSYISSDLCRTSSNGNVHFKEHGTVGSLLIQNETVSSGSLPLKSNAWDKENGQERQTHGSLQAELTLTIAKEINAFLWLTSWDAGMMGWLISLFLFKEPQQTLSRELFNPIYVRLNLCFHVFKRIPIFGIVGLEFQRLVLSKWARYRPGAGCSWVS